LQELQMLRDQQFIYARL